MLNHWAWAGLTVTLCSAPSINCERTAFQGGTKWRLTMGEPRNSLVVYSLDPLDQTGVIPHSRLFNMGQCDSFCSDMFTYSCQMLLLGSEFRVAHQFSIRSMHVYKHGWCWVFDPVVLVPTPFLMTDQTSMRVLYTGRVLFEPNDQLRGVLAQ